ncbi:hypothetical protein AAKU55_003142 [Oxalobacteraceae bacterium GrIS 1.11]
MSFLTRKRAILSKIETTYGVDSVPTGGADAILMSNLTVSPMETTLVQRQNIKSYMGNNPSVLAAIYAKVSFEVELAGSGAAGTPPPYNDLLRACGLSETILAAPLTGTSTAGSAGSMTLAAGASAVDGAYAGMTINITGGTGAGQSGVVASYVGLTKVATLTAPFGVLTDATSVYTVPAQVIYKPVSAGFESTTIYCNVDGIRHILMGARGTVALKAGVQTIPMLTFAFTGMYVTPTDVPIPAVTLTAFMQPLAVNNINTSGLVIAGYAGGVASDFSVDFANTVVFRSLVGGTESVVLTDRKPAGSLTFEATTVAAKDWWSTVKNVQLGVFSILHGTVPGNKVKIDGPSMQLTTPTYADKDGITMLTVKADFIPVNGNDELILSFQ